MTGKQSIDVDSSVSTALEATVQARSLPKWLLWSAAGVALLSGLGVTAVSLMLDSSQQGLRVATTTLGVFFVALSGMIASYVITHSAAVAETERTYREHLLRVGRSSARAWATLNRATAQRRSSTYAHEETYQEMVISAADSLLEQYETIVRVCGPAGDAFVKGKQDLAEITATLYSDDQDVSDANQAVDVLQTSPAKPEPVTIRCPHCGSRVKGKIALRVGWSSTAQCRECNSVFNIHRLSDMSVYPSPNPSTQASPDGPTEAERDTSAKAAETPSAPVDDEAGGLPTEDRVRAINCPRCQYSLLVSRNSYTGADGYALRVCGNCFDGILVDPNGEHVETYPLEVKPARIVGRRTAYALVECEDDGVAMKASIRWKSGCWLALCPAHRRAYCATRSEIRKWMSENAPDYLAHRLETERAGGTRLLLNE